MPRRDPFEEIEQLFDRMGREFEQIGGDLESSLGGGFNVDVTEDDETITVVADLPGYDRDEIDVTLADRTLTIAAERSEEHADEESDDDVQYHRRERRSRSVSRRIRLPADVDESAVSASYNNGVLTIELPKQTADAGGHHIDVE
ncbi:archaeal heat shock protein Hsp14 [Halopenitus sp. H-Gu1]|uniref:archaeal heat shock protein Hsp14 n=1 Tax=Halopenitus sp. H-Gu1 TaxID=3242697 RepID=UPI00359E271E